MKNKYYPNLASPITINGVTFKNRIFGAPMSNPELDPDCHMREEDMPSTRTGEKADSPVSASVLESWKLSDVLIPKRLSFMMRCPFPL